MTSDLRKEPPGDLQAVWPAAGGTIEPVAKPLTWGCWDIGRVEHDRVKGLVGSNGAEEVAGTDLESTSEKSPVRGHVTLAGRHRMGIVVGGYHPKPSQRAC